MFCFEFTYSDKRYQSFDHVEKAEYPDVVGATVTVNEDEMLTHKFPLTRDLHLFAKDASYMVSHDKLQFISVSKE